MDTNVQSKGNAGNGNPGQGGNNDKFVTLTIVVNTTPTNVTVNENVPLKNAAQKALDQTHSTGRPLSDYELKLNDQVLDMDKKVKDYGLKDGTELFLSLKAGTGGTN
jgi:hypothetical protein